MEEWKAIPGYEGLYEISDMGRIKSIARQIIGKTGQKYSLAETIIRQRYRMRGNRKDAVVNLSKNGKKKTFHVSRLVALAWCKDYQDNLTVNHIDGNPLNNNADNLECISREENVRRGHRDGLYSNRYRSCSLVRRDGETLFFHSTSDASRFLGRATSYVSSRIYLGRNTAYSISGEEYGLV